jgi:hypothetical protein
MAGACSFRSEELSRTASFHYDADVMDWTPRRIITVLVCLWMALLPALLAVPATAMAHQMEAAESTGAADCDCCDDTQTHGMSCSVICLSALTALAITTPADIATVAFGDDMVPARAPTLIERRRAPDPPPPKILS